ncbi:hypothetical protein [Amycolatopsis sp. H20-H5]|uniref:hypothetical protein n=1 Tax=Amycolatopsis sp. H20-H5 TaxID=3046309 RepID=UPI002DBDB4EE|nr:hypothetical protein [Amycolatopsis sp. H20-H5]MEC3975678.1 hypothetical protein [Amycolatopsis sp. H20-H5]
MNLAEKTATEVDEIVERELTQFWLQPGERLLLGLSQVHGHVSLRLGEVRHLPHVPARELPEVSGPARWPVPSADLPDEDWTDDPALAYHAVAQTPDQFAVRVADHCASSLGEARLTLTDRRFALVYATKRLAKPAEGAGPFTTFEEHRADVVRGVDSMLGGRSFPPKTLLRFTFADGSALHLHDVLAPMKAARALTRR